MLKVKVIQMNMHFCDVDYNYSHAEELVREAAAGADIIVLPEMWNTGFYPKNDLDVVCDDNGARTKSMMSRLAREYSVNIVAGSVANKKGGQVYNSAYIFNRKGEETAHYDKVHLFSPMGEDVSFTPGADTCTFELDGIRCGMAICYDIRFPEFIRTMALDNLDVFFVVSQWPKARLPHIDTLTRARAIENQMFLVYANAWAEADGTIYGGHSAVIDPLGEVMCMAEDQECIISAELDLSIVNHVRNTINVYVDRVPTLYDTSRSLAEK